MFENVAFKIQDGEAFEFENDNLHNDYVEHDDSEHDDFESDARIMIYFEMI